jgi:hypothetical protein
MATLARWRVLNHVTTRFSSSLSNSSWDSFCFVLCFFVNNEEKRDSFSPFGKIATSSGKEKNSSGGEKKRQVSSGKF